MFSGRPSRCEADRAADQCHLQRRSTRNPDDVSGGAGDQEAPAPGTLREERRSTPTGGPAEYQTSHERRRRGAISDGGPSRSLADGLPRSLPFQSVNVLFGHADFGKAHDFPIGLTPPTGISRISGLRPTAARSDVALGCSPCLAASSRGRARPPRSGPCRGAGGDAHHCAIRWRCADVPTTQQ